MDQQTFDFLRFMNKLQDATTCEHLQEAADMVTAESRNHSQFLNTSDGVVALMCRCGYKNEQELLRHIRHFVQLGATLKMGFNHSPLHYAANSGHPHIIRYLLDMGIPVDIPAFPCRFPPIHFARCRNYVSDQENRSDQKKRCVRVLCDAGSTECVKPCAFHQAREQTRSTCIATLGVIRCGGKFGGNGKDTLRIISRCIWSMRGFDEWARPQ